MVEDLNQNEGNDLAATIPQTDPVNTQMDEDENAEFVGLTLADLSMLTTENISEIKLGLAYYPFSPAVGAVSGNREVIATGGPQGVRLFDAVTQSEIMHIDITLPDCQYGWDATIALDYTGDFVAIATLTGIEVWQIGGGRIYETPYLHGKALDRLTCGLDVPQFSLSPQGKLLAESGYGIGGDEYGDYFRVTDVFKNEIVYSWDGSEANLHGKLQSFQGLGFSSDGKVLQTFIPARTFDVNANAADAFHFWNVEDWRMVDVDSDVIIKSFNPGALRFSISEKDGVQIYDKKSGEQILRIDSIGCTMDFPCDVIFSSNAKYLAILKRTGDLNYKRESLIDVVEIYEIETARLINTVKVILKHRNAVQLRDDGTLVYKEDGKRENAWWTNPAYIDGFFQTQSGMIGFYPQVYDIFSQNVPYSGTCTIDPDTNVFTCQSGIELADESRLTINRIGDGFIIQSKENALAQVKYPSGSEPDSWQIRIKTFNQQTGTGYFCLDRNFREETCVIMNFPENKIVKERVDLFGFVPVPKNDLSVFIDRDKKELNIFFEDTKRLEQMGSYQAIAFPVRPVLHSDGARAFYIVINPDTGRHYIEDISLIDAKVIKRYEFEIFNEISLSGMATTMENDILAVADQNGYIHFVDISSGEVINNLHISHAEIIDVILNDNGKKFYVLDATGKISVLWVEK